MRILVIIWMFFQELILARYFKICIINIYLYLRRYFGLQFDLLGFFFDIFYICNGTRQFRGWMSVHLLVKDLRFKVSFIWASNRFSKGKLLA